jgi:type II secretory pathway predicted ATPase ExeA
MNYPAFKKFLASAGLSTRRFGDLCGIGKTTVHRLAQPGHGGLTPKYVKDITPKLLRACQDHLTGANAPADAIHLVLSDIFGEEFVPSIITRATLTPDMLRFFGLVRDPFAAPRNATEVFLTEEMRHVAALLEDAVKFQGFVAVLAPVGAGKTIIKNLLMSLRSEARTLDIGLGSWDRTPVILSPKFADISRVTAAGIVAYILEEFHIKPRRSLVLAQKQLEDHLAELNTPVALCFDECHRLSDTTLTALKNFYELGTGGFRRYLGLVLFGQPQFEARLTLPRFREIAERLAVHTLAPFSAGNTEDFLNHCLTKAVPSGPPNLGPTPANGVFAPTRGGAPSSSDFGISILDFGLERKHDDGSAPRKHGNGGVPSSNSVNSPNSVNSLNFFFAPDAIRAIASRAATPLAVANLAAAGMIEAYRMGEPRVLARFIPGEAGPKTLRL